MAGLRTRGQPVAVAAILAMLGSGLPHALLLSGPNGVGKTTLALDLAAALLCRAGTGEDGPCRACRGCRMVEHGNHPDLHRLAPSGAGLVIPIGGRDERGVRELVHELAYLPVEGGARVAIVESADRMTEDAQTAFLKTLEEPPAGTTIILCADEEERLLPTIRSRCARVRLGPMGSRDIEAILGEQGVADAPTAARLGRITDGRPGHAIAHARAPEALAMRVEIERTLLDLLDEGVTVRLTRVRDLTARAAEYAKALEAGARQAGAASVPDRSIGTRGRSAGRRTASADSGAAVVQVSPDLAPATVAPESPDGAGTDDAIAMAGERKVRVPAAERRRAALALLDIWRSVTRDLAMAVVGAEASIRNLDLLDDLARPASRLSARTVGAALRRLDVAAERLAGNVSPELVLDVLMIHWAPAPER